MASPTKDIWPFNPDLISASLDEGYSALGPLSAAVALLDALAALDAATLPVKLETDLGQDLPLFSDIRALASSTERVLSKIDRTLRRVRAVLRECAVTREVVLCTAYESIIWDSIFRDLPNVLFFVVTPRLTQGPARLRYFSNVMAVDVDEIPTCRTVSRKGNEDRNGSAIVLTSYGHPKGESSRFVTLAQKRTIEQLLHQGFNPCVDLQIFNRELTSRPRKVLYPVDYPNRMSMRKLIEGFDEGSGRNTQ